jgi:hypothetical protein
MSDKQESNEEFAPKPWAEQGQTLTLSYESPSSFVPGLETGPFGYDSGTLELRPDCGNHQTITFGYTGLTDPDACEGDSPPAQG